MTSLVKLISKHTGNTDLAEAVYTRYSTDIKDNYGTPGKHRPTLPFFSMHTIQSKHTFCSRSEKTLGQTGRGTVATQRTLWNLKANLGLALRADAR